MADATPSYKILLLMKRRRGISVAEFRDYYENKHVPLCLQWRGSMKRYIRRYLDPQDHPETGPGGELPYDVITEMWFDDKEAYKATLAYLSATIMPDAIIADEKQLFDRSSFKIATVVECESDLAG